MSRGSQHITIGVGTYWSDGALSERLNFEPDRLSV
jgi:hypothetical protein